MSGKLTDIEHPDYLFAKEIEHIISLEITNSIGDVETVNLEAYYENYMLDIIRYTVVKINNEYTKDKFYIIEDFSITSGYHEASIINIEARRVV